MSSERCLECNDLIIPEKEISCDLCRKFIHSTCSGLSRMEVQCVKAKERKLVFFCSYCMDFKNQLASLNNLKDTVKRLENEINSLKNARAGRSNDSGNLSGDDNVVNIIDELQDRQARESNVIIFNLSESNNPNHLDRKKEETEKVTKILNSIDNTVNVTNLQLTRLGKFTHEKKRPIKVTLFSKADVLKILKNKKKTDSTIKIQADLTLMQRQYLVELRSKLSDLNKSGANKTIRYIRGKPQIVDAKN